MESTRWFCIRNLTRSLRSLVRFQTDTSPTRVKIPYARAFHEVISIYMVNTDSKYALLKLLNVSIRRDSFLSLILFSCRLQLLRIAMPSRRL